MWLHIPKTYYPCTQAEAASTLDSKWLYQQLEQSVTLRETSHQSQYWRKQSNKGTWMTRLFGQIPEPSTANAGVEKWIGSLADSHASHGRLRGVAQAKKMKGGSGMTSAASFAAFDPGASSWKTFQVSLLDMELIPYSETFPKWGTMLSGEASRPQAWAQITEGSVSSSWRTAAASDGEGGVKKMTEGSNSKYKLRDHSVEMMIQWMTPNTLDGIAARSIKAIKKQFQTTRKGRNTPANLREQVLPQMHPSAWAKKKTVKNPLAEDAALQRQLNFQFFPQDQAPARGNKYSVLTRITRPQWKKLRLNPMFVEWLMGWPRGYTDLTGLEYSETGSYLRRQLTHLGCLLNKQKKRTHEINVRP